MAGVCPGALSFLGSSQVTACAPECTHGMGTLWHSGSFRAPEGVSSTCIVTHPPRPCVPESRIHEAGTGVFTSFEMLEN